MRNGVTRLPADMRSSINATPASEGWRVGGTALHAGRGDWRSRLGLQRAELFLERLDVLLVLGDGACRPRMRPEVFSMLRASTVAGSGSARRAVAHTARSRSALARASFSSRASSSSRILRRRRRGASAWRVDLREIRAGRSASRATLLARARLSRRISARGAPGTLKYGMGTRRNRVMQLEHSRPRPSSACSSTPAPSTCL